MAEKTTTGREGWAFPTVEGREHFFRNSRSFCGKFRPPSHLVDTRLDEGIEDPCLICNRIATKEMAATWCEHEDPRDECPDCAEAHTLDASAPRDPQ